jgi:hypothetical protein
MGDELRITVIATGINSKDDRVMVDLEKFRPTAFELKKDRPEDRETPTFIRRGIEVEKIPSRSRPATPPEYYFDEEELEVPTFIRKAAD